ncbi:MAG: 2-C-methyl-D-erythritol 2,4-cyclodiphosphate synthase [Methylacidiphilales bacterium]|nr:2-C-methyl-D-erythritol 2,4-cyclodiphosphate synthase [Candidatus Methylacidiphilales bacterium]
MRVGQGFDIHRLAPNHRLVIGGVFIDSELGCVAHSDGDVLIHAICDALYGAMGEEDIGSHFPDSDIKYKNMPSEVFLLSATQLLKEKGYTILNLDTTIIIEKPSLKQYKTPIKNNLATILKIHQSLISIKAKTAETLGLIGNNQAVCAFATLLIKDAD